MHWIAAHPIQISIQFESLPSANFVSVEPKIPAKTTYFRMTNVPNNYRNEVI